MIMGLDNRAEAAEVVSASGISDAVVRDFFQERIDRLTKMPAGYMASNEDRPTQMFITPDGQQTLSEIKGIVEALAQPVPRWEVARDFVQRERNTAINNATAAERALDNTPEQADPTFKYLNDRLKRIRGEEAELPTGFLESYPSIADALGRVTDDIQMQMNVTTRGRALVGYHIAEDRLRTVNEVNNRLDNLIAHRPDRQHAGKLPTRGL